LGDQDNVKKSHIVVIVAAVVLALLAVVIEAVHERHVMASKAFSAATKAPTSASLKLDAASNDADAVRVIRFASNPAPMPPFLVNDLDGSFVSTAALQGKVVVLNFWATWCPPCREEIPEMIALANRYKDRLQIIGVSMDDAPPEEVREFAKAAGINYPVVMGSRAIAAEYGGVPALPTSFVADPHGRIVEKHVGLYPPEVYESEIRALLGLPVNARIETFEDTGQIFLKNAALATELPGVDLSGLTPERKRVALKRMNSENCTCGCNLTIAQCRINDSSCSISKQLAANIVREIRSGSSTPASPSKTIRQ
jgi:thiol-disulfide isomerase/thioredoxin